MSVVVKGTRNRKPADASTRKASRQRSIAFEQQYTYIPRGVKPGEWILPNRTQPLEQNKAVVLYNRSSKLSKNSVPDPHRIRDVSAVNRRFYDTFKDGNVRDRDLDELTQLLDYCNSNLQTTFKQKSELEAELKTIKDELSNTTERLTESERKIAEITDQKIRVEADNAKELAKMKHQAELRKGLTPSRISQPSIPIMKRFGKKNKEEQLAAAKTLAARRAQLRAYQDENPELKKRNQARVDTFGENVASYSKSPVAKRIQRMWKTPSPSKAKRDAYRRNKKSFYENNIWPDES